MSKKRIKSLFLLSLSVSSFVTFSTILSVDPEPENPPATPPEKPKEISKDFDTFKDQANSEFKKALKSSIENTIDKFTSQINQLNENNSISFEERIQKLNYFSQVIHFLTSNKDKILENPEQFGMNAVFLKALSRNKQNNKGTITFEGKEYSDVIFGNDDEISYKNQLSDKDKVEIKNKNENNFVTKEQMQKVLQDYSKKLSTSFAGFLFEKDEDIPKLTKDDLKQISTPNESGFTIKPPAGFKTWDEYLESKIKNRYTKFDLEQNKPVDDQQQPQTPKPPQVTPTPPIPEDPTKSTPDVSNKPPVYKPIDLMTRVPPLKPEIKGKYIGKTMSEIIEAFNSDNESDEQAKSDEFFFFNNPINTRYKYSVVKMEEQADGTNPVEIKITDLVKPEVSRRYKLLNISNDNKTEGFQYIYEKYIKEAQELFKKFYVALGIGERMEFEKIQDNYLNTSIFTLLTSAVKIVYNENFLKDQSQIVSTYADSVDSLTSPNIDTPVRLLLTQILSTLKNSEATIQIQNKIKVDLFQLITATIEEGNFGYDNALISIQRRIQSKQNAFVLEQIKSKFNYYNQDFSIVEKLYDKTKKDVFLAKALASQKTFNYINWFNKFTQLIGTITKEYNLWKALTSSDDNASKYLSTAESTAEDTSNPTTQLSNNNSSDNQTISQQTDEQTSEQNNNDNTSKTEEKTSENKEELSPEEQATKNFAQQIQEYKDIMSEDQKEHSPIMSISGIITTILSLIGLGFASFFRFFNKFSKHKTISKSMTILIIFTALILVMGIVLIALGFTGGII
ncbi:MSC_0620 family F1-like ATPase-associated subunit [Mesomycoplasma hyorhinis]|uniref:MSC_0620 family F1-like ATPase-associated subunit n=1 Tax=Mesomycoplasma hyorhinis TaxID=2100 RepID=UPI001C05339C|nr:hypothetical protein [Mesomycoplasma hyorhinis]